MSSHSSSYTRSSSYTPTSNPLYGATPESQKKTLKKLSDEQIYLLRRMVYSHPSDDPKRFLKLNTYERKWKCMLKQWLNKVHTKTQGIAILNGLEDALRLRWNYLVTMGVIDTGANGGYPGIQSGSKFIHFKDQDWQDIDDSGYLHEWLRYYTGCMKMPAMRRVSSGAGKMQIG
jgi:hypothetical protein